jgi:hypothetical protein
VIPYLKPALIAVSVVGVAAGSWMARGWFEDSRDLIAMEAQRALADDIRSDMGKVVRTVEDRLQDLKANERIIDRGIIREIERPVYRNVCVPPDGDAFRLLHSVANGEAPREPDDQGAEHFAPTD